jgi:hypothetical protein
VLLYLKGAESEMKSKIHPSDWLEEVRLPLALVNQSVLLVAMLLSAP